MLIRSFATSQYSGFVVPELRADSIQVQGYEASVTRVAERVGGSSVFSIPALAVVAGRVVSVAVSGRDSGQPGDFPQSPTITYRADGVQFASRRYRPVDRTRFFSFNFGPNIFSGNQIEISGPAAIHNYTIASSAGSSSFAVGRYAVQTLPFVFAATAGNNQSMSGFAFGDQTTIRARKISAGLPMDITRNITLNTPDAGWRMELVHAYVPSASGLIDLEVTVPGAWVDLLVVARQ